MGLRLLDVGESRRR